MYGELSQFQKQKCNCDIEPGISENSLRMGRLPADTMQIHRSLANENRPDVYLTRSKYCKAQAAGRTKLLIRGPTASEWEARPLASFLVLSKGWLHYHLKGSERRRPQEAEGSLWFLSLSFPLPWCNPKQKRLLAALEGLSIRCPWCCSDKQASHLLVNPGWLRALPASAEVLINRIF